MSEPFSVLAITERTLTQCKRDKALVPEEAEKLARLARVIKRSEEAFEDLQKALNWLQTPNNTFNNIPPISMLDTDKGTKSVMAVLRRIERGA